ncbi:MAG: MnhB domain-containing protein [Thermoplasmatota archaeon]
MKWRMSRVVRTVADVMVVPIVIYGIYLILHGHLTPGGGFQGGAVVASSVALLIVAYGVMDRHKGTLSAMESTGLTMFILIAFMGLGSTMFYNFLAGEGGLFGGSVSDGINAGYINTGGTVTLMNLMVGIEVIAALSLILYTMAMHSGSLDEMSEMSGEVEE